jgi:hypothetical protein
MSEEEKVINRLVADNKALRDLVDWQAADNKRLRDALRPFAKASTNCDPVAVRYDWIVIKRDDCDKARAALGGGKE